MNFISSGTKILVIMPHPDDETAFAAGFIHHYSQQGAQISLLTITSGDASTLRYGLTDSDNLAHIREQETAHAANVLGISKVIFGHIPDGHIETHVSAVSTTITSNVASLQPDIVLTLEPDGVYGHPDHITLTRIITNLGFPRVIYATVDEHFKPSSGAAAMARKPIHPLQPNFTLDLTPADTQAKVNAFKCHASQFVVDDKFLAKWNVFTLLQHEYFFLQS